VPLLAFKIYPKFYLFPLAWIDIVLPVNKVSIFARSIDLS